MSVSSQNVQPSFDPTAYTSLSGAQLKQLIDGILMYADKGLLITTADVAGVPQPPDADATTSWQRCIWMRVGATTVTPYIWVNTAAVHADGVNTLNKWYTIAESTIGPGAIGTAQLANNAVTDAKISEVNASKITGSLAGTLAAASLVAEGDAAGGDLTGTYPNPTVGPLSITTAKIANENVVEGKIGPLAVTNGKIGPLAVDTDKITDASVTLAKASTTFVNEATAKGVPVMADAVLIADSAAANINKKVLLSNLGISLQILVKTVGNAVSGSTVVPDDNTIPQITEGDEITTQAITLKSASSLVRLKIDCSIGNTSVNQMALFMCQTGVASALATRSVYNTSSSTPTCATLECIIASPGVGAYTFSVRFGGSGGTSYCNFDSVANTPYGASAKSFFIVEEFMGTLA